MNAEEHMERNADEQMKHGEPRAKKKALAKKMGGWAVRKKVNKWPSITKKHRPTDNLDDMRYAQR